MYHKKTYRVFSLTMALWLFAVSVGFTASEHYCQGMLKHITWFGEASSCHDQVDLPSCHEKTAERSCKKGSCDAKSPDDKPCCENETIFFQMEVDYSHFFSLMNMEEESPSFSNNVSSWILLLDHQLNSNSNYKLYKPPILPFEHRVFTQSFLL